MKRRSFVTKTAMGSLATVVGADIVFGNHLPKGYTPLGLDTVDPYKAFG